MGPEQATLDEGAQDQAAQPAFYDSRLEPSPKPSPLFKADKATIAFEALKDGKVRVTYQGWESERVVKPGEAFEISWGPQGVEGRIIPK